MPAVDLLLPPAGRIDLEGAGLRERLAALYALPGDRWVRVNLVTALDGRLAGTSGTSEDLTGGIDRTVLGVLRRAADVVLVGAGSLRAERLVHPRTAALAIATATGSLTREDLPAGPEGRRPLVLCPATAAAAQTERVGDAAEVLALAGDPVARPALLVEALTARGLRKVVCEGGAALADALLSAGVVDELDLTTAPVVAGGDGAALSAPLPAATLVGLLRDGTDRLYARWRPAPR